MPQRFSNMKPIEVLGLGTGKQFLFCKMLNQLDLYAEMVTPNPFNDRQFWIMLRVPNDDHNAWSDDVLALAHDFIAEKLVNDEFDVDIEPLFGRAFPRSVRACWYVSFSSKHDKA